MKTLSKGPAGFTLLEAVLTAAVGSFVILVIVFFVGKSGPFFKRINVRQQVASDSRACMDTILGLLHKAKMGTVVVSTPDGVPVVPNSRVDFALTTPSASGATGYAVYLANGSVYLQEIGPIERAPRAMASNVTSLMFTGNARDTGLISVTLRIDAPWDSTHNPTHVTTVLLPNQVVHLTGSL